MNEDVSARTEADSLNIDNLRRLADMNGVGTSYYGWSGEHEQVSALSLLKVLNAMGVDVRPGSTDEDVSRAIAAAEAAPWMRTLPATTVVRKGDWRDLPVHVKHGEAVRCWYVLEDGTGGDLNQLDRPIAPLDVDGELRGRATFEIPGTLPLGYHQVFAEVEGREPVSAPLYVVPQRIDPSALSGTQRYWGVNAQAYSVAARSGWGVGDAEDLADLTAICAQEGADFILINPLHASETVAPIENSPYRPVSRAWLNVTYIRPEEIPEYATLPTRKRQQIEELRKSVVNEGDSEQVHRDATWEAKSKALRWIFEQPRSIHREAEFKAFCNNGGSSLDGHALWSALTESVGSTELPEEYKSATSPESVQFAKDHPEEIAFHKWLQWIAAQQLSLPNRIGQELGMGIGIMADLAVGTHPLGSDYWSMPDIFASGMYVGAPPDMYSQLGQNWTQPPWIPSRLAEVGYEPFRQVIRAALKLAGALRIDHILGLFRLWWLPSGETANHGTYVYFDHEAMVGILLLEAERNDAILIGEDLGTVEPWVRTYLGERGIYGTSVFWFEKEEDTGLPLHADKYRSAVLGTVNTHDLPPTLGYMDGIQTTIRDQLGLLVDSLDDVRARDKEEQEQTIQRLREYGLIDSDDPTHQEVMDALHRYVSRTPSRLVAASLVDQVGEKRPQNFPGTEHEYPNWRVPLGDGNGDRIWLEDLEGAAKNPEDGSDIFSTMRDEFGRTKRGIL